MATLSTSEPSGRSVSSSSRSPGVDSAAIATACVPADPAAAGSGEPSAAIATPRAGCNSGVLLHVVVGAHPPWRPLGGGVCLADAGWVGVERRPVEQAAGARRASAR